MKKHLSLEICKECGSADRRIVIALPLLGRQGAWIECATCGHKTKIYNIHETIFTKTCFSTPVTKEAINLGVEKALEEWGYTYKGEENEID